MRSAVIHSWRKSGVPEKARWTFAFPGPSHGEAAVPTTTERGYGHEHRKERDRWSLIVNAGAASCTRCGHAVVPGQLWDLDHAEDRRTYLGPAHRYCNRAAGARKGNRSPRRRRRVIVRTWGAW